MKQYIDKANIVAEIEKRIKEIDGIGTYLSPKGVLTNLLCHLNATKVKEVDLEKEIEKWIDDAAITHEDCSVTDVISTAKYFFELGVKAQKGE